MLHEASEGSGEALHLRLGNRRLAVVVSPPGSAPDATGSRPVVGRIDIGDASYLVVDETPQEPPRSSHGTALLSRRELQVAVLIADGQCDKEIARHLGISAYTVREHIRRIFAKLNVCRRSAVIAHLLRHETRP